MDIETRQLSFFGSDSKLELRVSPEQPNRLVGYAARFNSVSEDLGGFKERIRPGAFKTSVAGTMDIRALVGHDSSQLLGRTSNGTLRLAEDDHGLRVEIDLPAGVSYADDIKALVQRGDIRGMSFGFRVREGGQKFNKEGGQIVRELSDIDLREVSVVATPAYSATSVAIRSCGIDKTIKDEIQKLTEEKNRPQLARCRASLRKTLLEA